MRTQRRALVGALSISLMISPIVTPSFAQPAPPRPGESLELYEATVSAEQWASIQGLGLDVASVEERPDGIEVQLVLYSEEEGASGARASTSAPCATRTV